MKSHGKSKAVLSAIIFEVNLLQSSRFGDPNQIDRPFLDERTNGLSYASEYMKGSPLCYQITMSAEECERSELAMDAIHRL